MSVIECFYLKVVFKLTPCLKKIKKPNLILFGIYFAKLNIMFKILHQI